MLTSGFFRLPHGVTRSMPRTHLLLWVRIMDAMGWRDSLAGERGTVLLDVDREAKYLNISTRSVNRIIKTLVAQGHLERDANWSRASRRYRVASRALACPADLHASRDGNIGVQNASFRTSDTSITEEEEEDVRTSARPSVGLPPSQTPPQSLAKTAPTSKGRKRSAQLQALYSNEIKLTAARAVADALRRAIAGWNADAKEAREAGWPARRDSWLADLEKLARIDGRPFGEQLRVADWLADRYQPDDRFDWRANVRSGAKFRRHYDSLAALARKPVARRGAAADPYAASKRPGVY